MIVCVAMAMSWLSGVERSRVLMLRIHVVEVWLEVGSQMIVGLESRAGGKFSVGCWEPRLLPISRVVFVGVSYSSWWVFCVSVMCSASWWCGNAVWRASLNMSSISLLGCMFGSVVALCLRWESKLCASVLYACAMVSWMRCSCGRSGAVSVVVLSARSWRRLSVFHLS